MICIIKLVAVQHKSNLAALRYTVREKAVGAEELHEEGPNMVGGKDVRMMKPQ